MRIMQNGYRILIAIRYYALMNAVALRMTPEASRFDFVHYV